MRIQMVKKKPTVISTFAGCGGSSLGYHLAGFKELLAVEWEDNAAETFKLNFPDVPLFHGDIAKLSVKKCLRLAGIKSGELDVFDGSPPCQGFSSAGARKLHDPRNSLFKEYCRLLKGLQPKVFVMENVRGMVMGHMKQVYLKIASELRNCGYKIHSEILNAMYYGVAQKRERIIIIGVRNDIDVMPSHPKPKMIPISVKQAIYDLRDSESDIALSSSQKRAIRVFSAGTTQSDVAKYNQKWGTKFYKSSHCRNSWDEPFQTILKSGIYFHPDKNRALNSKELARLSSYPDNFKFLDADSAKERIGNSVPPNLMKAIALHIKTKILTNPGKRI